MSRAARAASVAVAIAGLLLTAACSRVSSSSFDTHAPGLKIVTTVAPITSIVAAVAGDRAQVRGVVPEGADSHTFEPPPSTAKVLSQADVVFVNGLKLEDPTRELAQRNRKKGAVVIGLGSETIRPDQYLYDFSFPKSAGKPNPHLWTDPPLAKEYGRIARDVVSARDPAHADVYRANYDRFASEVDALDNAMKAATATVPTPKLLTYHDAYAYFAQHYGWKVIGAIQVSSFEDPTPKEIAALQAQVKAEGVKAIFGSEVFPSDVLAQIGRDTGVRYVDKLRDDDLPGKPGAAEHSWFGLMRFDFLTMVSSLGGDASALNALPAGSAMTDMAYYPQ